jgi:hypothetical protein
VYGLFLCEGDGEVKLSTMSTPFQELARTEASYTESLTDVDRMFLQAKIEKRLKDEYMVKYMGIRDVPTVLYQTMKTPEQAYQQWQFHIMPHMACIVKNASNIAELQSQIDEQEETVAAVQMRWEDELKSMQSQIDAKDEMDADLQKWCDEQTALDLKKLWSAQTTCREEIQSAQDRVEDIPDEIALLWCQVDALKTELKALRGKKKSPISVCNGVIEIVAIIVLMAMVFFSTVNF